MNLKHRQLNPYEPVQVQAVTNGWFKLSTVLVISFLALGTILQFGAWPLANYASGGYMFDSVPSPRHYFWWAVARRMQSLGKLLLFIVCAFLGIKTARLTVSRLFTISPGKEPGDG